jgi:hypothetical protein
MKYAIIGFLVLCPAALAQEQPVSCTPPAAPEPLSVDMPLSPANPACAPADGVGTGTCSEKQIREYNAKVDAYNKATGPVLEKLNKYGKALADYRFAANEYHNCEVSRINDIMRRAQQ